MNGYDDLRLSDFNEALVDCRNLYRSSAEECTRDFRTPQRRSQDELVEWFDELHRGLLVRVYFDVAAADRKWPVEEQQLAQCLIEHLWNRRLEGAALRDATKGLRDRSQNLTMRSVVKPFLDFPNLRDHFSELSTVVLRLANLVAKADGRLTPDEEEALRKLQSDFHEMRVESAGQTKGHESESNSPWQQAKASSTSTTDPTQSQPTRDGSALPPPKLALEDAVASLDQLIGLDQVKSEVRTLVNYLKIQQHRNQAGLPQTPVSLHQVFVGNPGTGKTTVARIVGQIYGALGILGRGHLVETDRSGLVAEYAGQTATKTNAKIDEAIGGVLFVDEAYSLVADSAEDAFGREAIQTLLKRMEDDRHQLAVVLAGYPKPMEALLRTNPGLSSRFGRTLRFEDYDHLQLAEIFETLCEQHRYELTWQVRFRLLVGLQWLFEARDEHFGNGRLVRNLFEEGIRNLSNRIVNLTPITHELLTRFQPEDLTFPTVHKNHWQRFAKDTTHFVADCDGCNRTTKFRPEHLGCRMRCKKCGAERVIRWANAVGTTSAASDVPT